MTRDFKLARCSFVGVNWRLAAGHRYKSCLHKPVRLCLAATHTKILS